MTKKILCPYCKADLKKVGFSTYERSYLSYDWNWNKKYFEADEGTLQDDIQVENATCNNCDKDILGFVRDNNLI